MNTDEIKKGDRVICIDDRYRPSSNGKIKKLTRGNIYVVDDVSVCSAGMYIGYTDNEGRLSYSLIRRFQKLTPEMNELNPEYNSTIIDMLEI